MRVRSSAILLIALVGGVLLDVALLPLLVRILRTLLAARGSRLLLLICDIDRRNSSRLSMSQKQLEQRHAVPTDECREIFRKV
jgi:hypothetical protein